MDPTLVTAAASAVAAAVGAGAAGHAGAEAADAAGRLLAGLRAKRGVTVTPETPREKIERELVALAAEEPAVLQDMRSVTNHVGVVHAETVVFGFQTGR